MGTHITLFVLFLMSLVEISAKSPSANCDKFCPRISESKDQMLEQYGSEVFSSLEKICNCLSGGVTDKLGENSGTLPIVISTLPTQPVENTSNRPKNEGQKDGHLSGKSFQKISGNLNCGKFCPRIEKEEDALIAEFNEAAKFDKLVQMPG